MLKIVVKINIKAECLPYYYMLQMPFSHVLMKDQLDKVYKCIRLYVLQVIFLNGKFIMMLMRENGV